MFKPPSRTTVYLHTICLEPARWTPQRVSRSLAELLPDIAESGFTDLEIFEPHLTLDPDATALAPRFDTLGLRPVVLSSYLDLNPAATPDAALPEKFDTVVRWIETIDFKKLRLFPAPKMHPDDSPAIACFTERLGQLARRIPQVEVLLETHDGSLADRPELLGMILKDLSLPNVGLLYQPTRFDTAEAIAQMASQKPFVRHIHLQNRHPDLSFATLATGVVSWPRVLAELGKPVSMSLEFVPSGICSIEQFDLAATLRQARTEAAYIETVLADLG